MSDRAKPRQVMAAKDDRHDLHVAAQALEKGQFNLQGVFVRVSARIILQVRARRQQFARKRFINVQNAQWSFPLTMGRHCERAADAVMVYSKEDHPLWNRDAREHLA